MHALRRKTFSQRHLAWLLCLVLLLPMAQTAATWHLLSHAQWDPADAGTGKQANHLGQCDLCLSAAALIGGAPLVSSPHRPQDGVFHEVHGADLRGIVWLATTPAYNSRAPPSPLD
jgi:hypothetical protein